MNTHIEMLLIRIHNAQSFGELLRGVRRSKVVAGKHGILWPLIRDAAYGQARQQMGVAA